MKFVEIVDGVSDENRETMDNTNLENRQVFEIENQNEESEDDEPGKKKSRHSFTVSKKLEAIEYAKKNSITATAKRFSAQRGSMRVMHASDASIEL